MKNILLFLTLAISQVLGGHIYNWNNEVSYNSEGYANLIKLYFSLETGLPANNFIQLEFPFNPEPSVACVYEYDQRDTMLVESTDANTPSNNNVILQFDKELVANTWYTLEIEVTNNIQANFYESPVKMYTTSLNSLTNQIIYDLNEAFTQINIHEIPIYTQMDINTAFQTNDSNKKSGFGQQNFVFFDITPYKTTSTGGIFYIEILSTEFSFGDTCISVKSTGQVDIDALESSSYECAIDSEYSNRIKLVINSEINTSIFRIKALVINPYIVSESGYKVYYYEKIGNNAVGQIQALAQNDETVFQTKAIQIEQFDFKVLWGFKYTDSNSQVLRSLYVSDESVDFYVYNNVQFTFQVGTSAPSDSESNYYKLNIRVQHTAILDGSISHNLPNSAGKTTVCNAVSADPEYYIECKNVGALSSSTVYFVSAKVVYDTSHGFDTTNNDNFGRVQIIGITVDEDDLLVEDTSLFKTPNEQITLDDYFFLQATSYVASTDTTDGYQTKLGNTQVVSVLEEEGDTVATLWAKQSLHTQGIQNTQDNQALIFYLEASKAETCGADGACTSGGTDYGTQQVKMELYFNHNALQFEDMSDQSGIQLASYISSGVVEGAACTEDVEPQCINYIEGQASIFNEANYNYKTLYPQNEPAYGLYQFYCGDNSQAIDANTELCIFDGKLSSANYENSLLLMRDVKLSSQFSYDNFYAYNENQLDFVLAFYSGQMSCSGDPCKNSESFSLATVSVIHGYTISDTTSFTTEWDNLFIKFVNFWQDNDGAKVPTYLRIKGTFDANTITENNSIGVFFDNSVKLSFLKDYDDDHGYYCSGIHTGSGDLYRDCEAIVGTSLELTANWRNQHGVIFKNLELDTNDIDLYIPVETLSTDPTHITIALFTQNTNSLSQKKYETKAVYKIYGTGDVIIPHDIVTFQSNAENMAAAIARPGSNAGGDNFVYGLEEYDIDTNTLVFTPTITGETNTNADFTSETNGGAGLTIVSSKMNIFSDSISLNLDSSGDFPCYNIQYSDDLFSIFCPFDSGVTTINAGNSDIGVQIVADGFPVSFYADNIFSYGLCDGDGLGSAINFEASKLVTPSVAPTCTLVNGEEILNANDAKPQYFTTKITLTNPISLDFEGLQGTAYIEVGYTFSVGGSAWDLETYCSSGIEFLDCVFDEPNAKAQLTVQEGIEINSINSLSIQLQLQANKALDAALTFDVSVKIGNSFDGTTTWIWGDQIDDDEVIEWETCTAGNIDASGTAPVTNNFVLGDTVMLDSNIKEVPSKFEILFGPGAERTKIYQSDYIEFEIGWVNENQYYDFRCLVYDGEADYNSEYSISYDWNSIDISALPIIKVIAKEDIQIEDPPQTYKLSCIGAVVPDPSGTDAVSAKWVDQGGVIDIQTTTDTISVSGDLVNAPSTFNSVVLTKQFASPGQNAYYLFTVESGQDITQQSTIYVQFTKAISPRLNSMYGRVECTVQDIEVVCIFIQERRLQISIPQSISGSTEFKVLIKGVTMQAYDSDFANKDVYFGVSFTGEYNSIDIGQTVTELELSQNVDIFPIFSAELQPQQVRNKAIHTIYTQFPLGVVQRDNKFYVDINASPYSKLWTPLCRLERTEDTSAYNWVSNCKFISDERLELTFKSSDSNSTLIAKEYKIEISNGPSPGFFEQNSPKNIQRYQILIATDQTQASVLHQSVFQSELAEVEYTPSETLKNINFRYYNNDMTSQESDKVIVIQKGYLSAAIELYSQAINLVEDIFSSSFSIALTGQDSTLFQVNKGQWKSLVDQPNPIVKIGAKSDTYQGQFRIETFKSTSRDLIYVKIPPVLTIQVQANPCTDLFVSSTLIKVPLSGKTSQLKVYFTKCFPISDITLIGTLSDTSKFEFEESSLTLTNEGDYSRDMLQFQIKSIDSDSVAGDSATITWAISGTDSAYFELPDEITVEISTSDDTTTNPTATLAYDQDAQQEGQISFQLECDQDSLALITAYDDTYQDVISWHGSIMESLDQGYLEQIDYDQYDTNYEIINSKFVSAATATSITISKVKADSKYKLTIYCINNAGLESAAVSNTDVMTLDNGGRNVKITLTFEQNIDASIQAEVVCSLSELLVINPFYIITEDNIKCAQIQAFSYDQQKFPSPEQKNEVTFFILKNYSLSSDQTYQKIQNLRTNNSEFIEQLTASIQSHLATAPNVLSLLYSSIDEPSYTDDANIPLVNLKDVTSSYNSMKFSIELVNTNGFLFVGFQKTLETQTSTDSDGNQQTTTIISADPKIKQLFYGKDGNNKNEKVYTNLKYGQKGAVLEFTLDDLEQSKEYTLYYVLFAGENINPDGVTSGMFQHNFISVPSNLNEIDVKNSAHRLSIQYIFTTFLVIIFSLFV